MNGKPGKTDVRAEEGKMVGYVERGTYLLYSKSGEILLESRDVEFEEGRGNRSLEPNGGENDEGNDEEVVPFDPKAQDQQDPDPDTSDQNPSLEESSDPIVDVTPTEKMAPHNLIQVPLRRSTRARTKSSAIIESMESSKREEEARKAGEEWAGYSEIHTANLAKLVDEFGEVDSSFNIALIAMGIPPVPKSYSVAMEDPSRWENAIQKELECMKEFGVFGDLQDPPPDATILVPLWVFAHKLNGDGKIVDEKARLLGPCHRRSRSSDQRHRGLLNVSVVIEQHPRHVTVFNQESRGGRVRRVRSPTEVRSRR